MQGKTLSERVRSIADSPTLALNARVKELIRKGEKVINLSVGEPDSPTPERVKKTGISAIQENFTRYTPSRGIPDLISAIQEKFSRENGIEYSPEEIMVTPGAKFALYLIFQTLLDPGDEVIIPVPYWVSYPEQVKLAGGIPIFVESGDDHLPDLEKIREKISSRTKILLINSPNNPSGRVFPPSLIESLAGLCRERGLWLVSDEIYEKLIFKGEHLSPASLSPEIKEITLTVNGFSKTFSMTGWRLGYVAGKAEVIKAMAKIQSQSVSCPDSIAQRAGVTALKEATEDVERMIRDLRERKEFLEREIPSLGLKLTPLEGTFYAFLGLPPGREDSKEFARRLLEEFRVAVVPGVAFGKEGYIRMSYAVSLPQLQEGVEKLRRFLS